MKSVIYNKDGNIIDQDQSPSLKDQLQKLKQQGRSLPDGWWYKYQIKNKEEIKRICDDFGYPYPDNS